MSKSATRLGLERFRPINGAIAANNGISLLHGGVLTVRASFGIVVDTGEQAFNDPVFSDYSDDYFNGWTVQFIGNDGTNTSNLTAGEINFISDFHGKESPGVGTSPGTFDTDLDWSGSVLAGDMFHLIPPSEKPGWTQILVDITMAAGGTGSVAEHETLTVTGLNEIATLVLCTTSITGTGSIQYGFGGETDKMIAVSVGTTPDAGELWFSSSPTTGYAFKTDALFETISDGVDIGYEVSVGTLTAGVLRFMYLWRPLEPAAFCAAGAGAAGAI